MMHRLFCILNIITYLVTRKDVIRWFLVFYINIKPLPLQDIPQRNSIVNQIRFAALLQIFAQDMECGASVRALLADILCQIVEGFAGYFKISL